MDKWYDKVKEIWHVLKAAAADWSHDRAPRLGAALAYYTIFSIVPLLIVIIAMIGLVFGEEAAQSAITGQISGLMGPQSSAAIKDMIHRADQPSSGIISTIIATLTLLFGAAGFFGQLKDALNTVWGIEPKTGSGIWGFLKDNFLSFATLLGTAFLLLVSLVVSTALAAFGEWFGSVLPIPEVVLHAFNVVLSFAVITGLFALIFKVLPDARIAWRDVWIGAALTAALFTIGKFAIGLYLAKSNVASGYGAAGSLVLMLVWVYYSAQILLYGAEFTQVYADWMGQRIQPTEEANVTANQAAVEAHQDPRKKVHMPRPRRPLLIAGAILAVFIVAVFITAFLLSDPVKRYAEREAKERLPDYEVTIGKLRLRPFRLGIGLQDIVVRLRVNPEPPLAEIPAAKANVSFFPLLTGKIDVNLEIEDPQVAATSQQMDSILNTPKKKEIVERTVAWQDTLREMMPIRVALSLSNGEVRYQSDPNVEPIQVHELAVEAANVTNRPAESEPYPSTLRLKARVSDDSEVAWDSRADFLAKPSPRVEGDLKVEHFALPVLRPLTSRYNVQFRQGTSHLAAHVKYADPTTVIDVNDLLVEGARVDYVRTAQTKQKEEQQVQKGAEKAKEVHQDPAVVVKVSRGTILRSDVGFINKAASPDYRVFLSDLNLELQNFSNRPEDGMGTVKLTGKFMGAGPTEVTGSFRPEKPNPDFKVLVRIVKTPVDRLNKLLEAHGHINASQGTFAFFSDMTVKNNRIEGYVKPFLKDVQVYDPEQDKDKKTTKVFETVVNGVLDLFRSTPTGQVATKTDVSGPVENPHTSTWQILGKLVENAFFKAILPGFEESKA